MSDDGILSVHNGGIIPAFVEHTHIHAQNIGKVDSPAHGALVWADNHKVVVVDAKIRHRLNQGLQKLVGGHIGVKALKRDRVLHTGVVGVKGDDVGHAHVHQFLQGKGTVQGLPLCAFMLPSLVEEGHNDVDPAGFAVCRGNDTLQILIMVIRGHVIFMAADRIGKAEIADIYHNKHIGAPDRFADDSLGFPGAEAGAGAL